MVPRKAVVVKCWGLGCPASHWQQRLLAIRVNMACRRAGAWRCAGGSGHPDARRRAGRAGRFRSPMVDVGRQPLLRGEFGCRAAGDQADAFGLASRALTVQPGDLPGAGKAQFLTGDRGADDPARYPLAFLFFALVPGVAAGGLGGDKRGEPGSGSFDSRRFLSSGVFSLKVRE